MKYKIHVLLLILLISTPGLAFPLKDSLAKRDSVAYSRFYPMELKRLNFGSAKGKCDACGCSASGGSMGFSSMLNNNFVGVRYFYQNYSSRDGIFANSPWVDEHFNTIQIWSRIPLTKKIQVSALIPYHFHNRALSTGTENIEGLGDITVMAMYAIIQTMKDSVTYSHKLQLGGGVKAPTGKYSSANNLGSVNPSFQVGTGSWDYLLVADYVIKRKQLGLNSMVNYSIKTENQKNYQFGNQLNYGSMLFYLLNRGKVRIAPQAGIAGERYEGNTQYGQALANTSGDVIFGKYGIEVGSNRLSIGLNLMQPIHQNLTGGNVKANYRWGVNLNYSL
ncbi:transporter [Flavobacterium sp.]|uniref:transporter n=1 Tax=Flavobacterium sp. TaxID=239 RepID=UPI003454B278